MCSHAVYNCEYLCRGSLDSGGIAFYSRQRDGWGSREIILYFHAFPIRHACDNFRLNLICMRGCDGAAKAGNAGYYQFRQGTSYTRPDSNTQANAHRKSTVIW